MRILALSDVHIDFEENRKWLFGLSQYDYKNDFLILAGDVTHDVLSLARAFEFLKCCFLEVIYTPGNHDLWVLQEDDKNSLEKFNFINHIAEDCGIRMDPITVGAISIVPLLGWYDYSFGKPSNNLLNIWSDYISCEWPDGFNESMITQYFVSMNESFLSIKNQYVISFSHYLPRLDLVPSCIPLKDKELCPVFGTSLLEKQIRRLGSHIHIYGHHHLNVSEYRDNILYINNAFGYPYERLIAAKDLNCVLEI